MKAGLVCSLYAFMFRRLLYHMKGIVLHASPSLPCWPSRPSLRLHPLSSQPINQKCIKSKVGPIKDRIPPRTVDKAYLINKCFSIRAGLRLPPCPCSCLWYLIIPSTTSHPKAPPLYAFVLSAMQHVLLMNYWHEAYVLYNALNTCTVKISKAPSFPKLSYSTVSQQQGWKTMQIMQTTDIPTDVTYMTTTAHTQCHFIYDCSLPL